MVATYSMSCGLRLIILPGSRQTLVLGKVLWNIAVDVSFELQIILSAFKSMWFDRMEDIWYVNGVVVAMRCDDGELPQYLIGYRDLVFQRSSQSR